MDPLTYELLSRLAAGKRVLQPRGQNAEAQEEFREVFLLLRRLRELGFVSYLDGHVSTTSSGAALAIGPVLLTAEGESVLRRDRLLGQRPPYPHTLPWRD